MDHALTQITSVRSTGTVEITGGRRLRIESVHLVEDGRVVAGEVWLTERGCCLYGHLGVDGGLWTKYIGQADGDRNAATWRPLVQAGVRVAGVTDSDVMAASSWIDAGDRLSVAGYLLGVAEPELVGTEETDGRPLQHYAGIVSNAGVIAHALPDRQEFWRATLEGAIDDRELDIWVSADNLPVTMRLRAVDPAGRGESVQTVSYTYDSPDDSVTAPG